MHEGGPTVTREDPATRRLPARVALLGVLAAVASLSACGPSDDDGDAAGTSTTTDAPHVSMASTTSQPSTPTPPTPDELSPAVWPWADSSQRFEDPVAAAYDFAVDFVGFTNPTVGEFMQGDSRSGEVEVRPRPTGPATTVFVRQLGSDGSWWVLGCATANIEVSEPSALAVIATPVALRGRANAFEGNVNVEIRADGTEEPVGKGFVTGRMGEMGPFDSTLAFSSPAPGGGAVVFRTLSAEDGSVWEAAVVRVRFASGD